MVGDIQATDDNSQSGEMHQLRVMKILIGLLAVCGAYVKDVTNRVWAKCFLTIWFILCLSLNFGTFLYILINLSQQKVPTFLKEGPAGSFFLSIDCITNFLSYISVCYIAWYVKRFILFMENAFSGKPVPKYIFGIRTTIFLTVVMVLPMLGKEVHRFAISLDNWFLLALRLAGLLYVQHRLIVTLIILTMGHSLLTLYKQFSEELRTELDSMGRVTVAMPSLIFKFRQRYEGLVMLADLMDGILNFPIGIGLAGSLVVSCFSIYFLISGFNYFDMDHLFYNIFHLWVLLMLCSLAGRIREAVSMTNYQISIKHTSLNY